MSSERSRPPRDEYDIGLDAIMRKQNWKEMIAYAEEARLAAIKDSEYPETEKIIRFQMKTLLDQSIAYSMLGNYKKAIKKTTEKIRLSHSIEYSDFSHHSDYLALARYYADSGNLAEARRSLVRSISCVYHPSTVEFLAITFSELAEIEKSRVGDEQADYLNELSAALRKERQYCIGAPNCHRPDENLDEHTE